MTPAPGPVTLMWARGGGDRQTYLQLLTALGANVTAAMRPSQPKAPPKARASTPERRGAA